MNRRISKVAVLGSGVMGSRIACHFANIGVSVLLLDRKAEDQSSAPNRIVDEFLATALKSNPSPVFSKSVIKNIRTGNFEDNMKDISSADWIIEAVVERLDIKKEIFEKVEMFRKPGTIITSNTSGIPIHAMTEGRSDDFKKNFLGAHFFNPPRYLQLLEVIPTKETEASVVSFLMDYGDRFLGKTTVLCKDTPAFIGNRVGVYAMLAVVHLAEEFGLSVEEIDRFTGPLLGRPKSATFRTADVVGLDTLVNVANGLYENAEHDEARELFKLPAYVQRMLENRWLGEKSGQGFYKKVKGEKGASEILALDLKTLEYREQGRVKSETLEAAKGITDLRERIKFIVEGNDKAAQFTSASIYSLLEYVSNRVPEITDDFYRIDEAMRAGFGWELGPFEIWDALGVRETVEKIEEIEQHVPGQMGAVADWVKDMLDAGYDRFYKTEDWIKKYYDRNSKTYQPIPGSGEFIILDNLREKHTVWKNSGLSIIDLGDGILNAEIHSKMNTIGGDVLQGINKAIDLAEKGYRGLIIGNDGANFSAGANLGMIFMLAVEQEFEELNMAVKMFQDTSMRIRYSSIPVVLAPFNLTLGGGCEFAMHADFVQAYAETYMGLVEFGVGVIPGGGGSKEMALRASDEFKEGQIEQNVLKEKFLTIGQAKVSTSALEAFELGYLQRGRFAITMNKSRLLADAKAKAIELADAGYTQPKPREDIRVLGNAGLGIVYAGANSMYAGNYISEHDKLISEKLGWVLCGGNLSAPTEVTEQYLLDLERKEFMSLAMTKKSLERIQFMLTKGKPLRN